MGGPGNLPNSLGNLPERNEGDVTPPEKNFAKSCGNCPAILCASPVSKVGT